jgi:uncharacterized protein YcfL
MLHKLLTIGLLALLLAVGCSRIHEPWVQDNDRLVQERARPAEQIQALQHRLLTVQTDR